MIRKLIEERIRVAHRTTFQWSAVSIHQMNLLRPLTTKALITRKTHLPRGILSSQLAKPQKVK
ncbi:hypothetical protein [Burkholderia cenocepacia]|uniref:hypothetical protein n=1 Tax=Burkholderia cenocepacia TaxID=95486 RepID=UPI0012ECAFF9|nr:hypothetical protein [Burkholderia cenocepacia]MCW3678750.1 hypothetical protein [Burkholderia cenocepacia]MDC6086533.1 hypothetical protein [Burkholderia cenocepacia]